jgi:hypothetical protein
MVLKVKLNSILKLSNKDKAKMLEQSDILSEIEAVKENPEYMCLLTLYDTAIGINPTVTK